MTIEKEVQTQVNSILEQALSSDEGYQTLLLIREIYYGNVHLVKDCPAEILDALCNAKLVEKDPETISLTTYGYIFGNICKEYCNWVDNDRQMPQPKPPEEYYKGKVVLDLGCSFGRWLWEFEGAEKLIGIEMQEEYVDAAKVLSKKESKQPIDILNASIEALEDQVEPDSIDFAFCRLVFNHVYIDNTLAQVYRSMASGGKFWLHVEDYSFPFSILRNERRILSKLRALFTIFNSMIYMMFGKQISLRVKGRMHETHKTVYPSSSSWRKALESAGFTDISFKVVPAGYIFVASK